MDVESTPFIWGDAPEEKKISFAERLKQSNAKMSTNDLAARAAKFETGDNITFREIIVYFHESFSDTNCVQQLMAVPSMPGRQKWNIIFSRARMVDKVMESFVKFPSMPEEQVFFTPVRRRALLITIPDASPDISDDEIRFELEKHGTVQRVLKQTWEGFPNIFNGKRLVTIYPSGCKELPPFILIRNRKILLSFKGKPVFCNICMKDSHRSGDCPSRNVKHCYLCGSTDHEKSNCEKFVSLQPARGRTLPGEIEDDEASVSSDISADAMSEPEKEPETPKKPEITEESPTSTKTRAPSPTTSKVPENKHPSAFPPFKKATKRAIVTTPEKQPKSTKVKPKPKDNVK